LEEGLFPHARSREDLEEVEEERRLFYVAITRAERYLYLTYAHTRRRQGQLTPTTPSRFLKELPQDLLQDLSGAPDDPAIAREPHVADSSVRIERDISTRNPSECAERRGTSPATLREGARVRHPIYGIGHILTREESGAYTTVTVIFPGLGKRKFVEGVAPLELVP
jgi:DNA helicase-2/ATP-dependent DNA helicase PcrA